MAHISKQLIDLSAARRIPPVGQPVEQSSLVTTTSKMPQSEAPDVGSWLDSITSRLEALRGVVVPEERYLALLNELTRANFTTAQMRLAEAWILFGDWMYKGKDPVLEISDFFPSEEKLKPIAANRNLLFMTHEERIRLCKAEYDRGHTDGMVETRQMYPRRTGVRPGEPEGSEAYPTMDGLLSSRLKAAREELALCKGQCAKLQAIIDGDENPVERENVMLKMQALQRDYRTLAEEYWMLKADADRFNKEANELMSRLLRTKTATQAWNVLEEYRADWHLGEEMEQWNQAGLDHAAYRMRVGDRYKRAEQKKRRATVEDKIQNRFPSLVRQSVYEESENQSNQ